MTDPLDNGARRQADVIIARLELQTAETNRDVKELKLWLMGDGSAANPGVMIRLDRLEQIEQGKEDDEKSTKAWRLGLLASICLLFIERFGHYFWVWVAHAPR